MVVLCLMDNIQPSNVFYFSGCIFRGKVRRSITHCACKSWTHITVELTEIKLLLLTLFLQIVGDIAAVLPSYTLLFLQEKEERVGNCQEFFGNHITCVPLDRNKLVFQDVSKLTDITLMDENVQNGHNSVGDLGSYMTNEAHESEQQKFSGKSDMLAFKLLLISLNMRMLMLICGCPVQIHVYQRLYVRTFLDMVMLDISFVSWRRMMWNAFKFRQSFKNFVLQS